MVLSGEDRRNSKQATHFWIFKTSFDNDKVRDPCRFTGKYEAPAEETHWAKHEAARKCKEWIRDRVFQVDEQFFCRKYYGKHQELCGCVIGSAKPNLKHLTLFDEKLATTKSELSWCSISQSIVEWASLTSAGLWCMIFTITKSRLRMEIVRSFYS